jgi:hypothetical protein
MSSLTGNLISSTYQSLLKIGTNSSASANLTHITDGFGNNTSAQISTSQFAVSGAITVTGSLTAKKGTVDSYAQVDGEYLVVANLEETAGTYINKSGFEIYSGSSFLDIAVNGTDFLLDSSDTVIAVSDATGSAVIVASFQNQNSWTDGTVQIWRPLTVTGSVQVVGDVTANNFIGTASYAETAVSASYFSGSISNAVSASYALSSSYTVTASAAVQASTASYILNAVSSSYANNASIADSSTSASYALNTDLLDGKNSTVFATTGSNTFTGDQTVSGSIIPGDLTYNLGSATNPWKEIYVSTGSIVFVDNGVTVSSLGVGTNGTQISGSLITSGSMSNGISNQAIGLYSHAEGTGSIASGSYSHAEGVRTRAIGVGSHAEGFASIASGSYSHAEGVGQALGLYSHAEGGAIAYGTASHAEGNGRAYGLRSHAEGGGYTYGTSSHAEGNGIAIGDYSHAEGSATAYAEGSHAEGFQTIASASYSSVVGAFNLHNNDTSLFVIGDGQYVGPDLIRHDLVRAERGSFQVTGSLNVSTAGITGSLLGTSSYAMSAATASVAISASQATIAESLQGGLSTTTGNWTLTPGVNNVSFSADPGYMYQMWVRSNVPNGIISWIANVVTSNTNVPVIGSQYGWYYATGNALVLNSMPNQIAGTSGSIINSPASYAPNTSNVFNFSITNNSGTDQVVYWGYIKM